MAPQVQDERDRIAMERAERRASSATRLSMRRRGDGSTDLHARIPDAVAARLKTCLDAYTSPRTAGGNEGGVIDPATGARLPHARLLGQAFCSLLEAIPADAMPLHGGSATTVVVTIDLEALRSGLGLATTGDGTTLTASETRRLACQAGLIPAVLGGKSEPLDLGRRRRLFSPAQRLALAMQHPTCRAEGCTVPATWCEAHHWRRPWAQGGRTDLADGKLLCPWHHHRAHDAALRDPEPPRRWRALPSAALGRQPPRSPARPAYSTRSEGVTLTGNGSLASKVSTPTTAATSTYAPSTRSQAVREGTSGSTTQYDGQPAAS